jgi:excisionase family DNA binding protein
MSTPLGVSPAEAARLLGLSRTTIYRMIRRKQIKTTRVGTRVVVPVAELTDLLSGGSAK